MVGGPPECGAGPREGWAVGHKVRNIDDLSEFSVNECYGPGDLGGIDEVVSLAAAWMRVHGPQDEGVIRSRVGGAQRTGVQRTTIETQW